MPDDKNVAAVKARVAETLGSELKTWPGGYPDALGLALTDAVLSIRAKYGNSPTSGVRAAVARLKSAHSDAANNLSVLANLDPEALAAAVDNHQRSGGRLKTQCIVDGAKALSELGIVTAADYLAAGDEQRKRAYLSVKGLGPQTYAYLGMLVGVDGVKADVWVQRFVEAAIGRAPSPTEAQDLVVAVAEELAVSASRLDHAIWDYQRAAEPDRAGQIEEDAEGVGED